ncbi:MAG: winged helix DNA-binding domain-containing protein [Bacteroidota bacterium]
MTIADIRTHRLVNQRIATADFTTPVDLVCHLGAIQAQEYALAKWAIGLRMQSATDSMIEEAFNNGNILRTHILRPTWHFIAPADIRWMLSLSGPRVQAFNAYYYRKEGLDAAMFKRCNKVIAKTLRGNNCLTRNEIADALSQSRISAAGTALACIMMNAELEGLVCSGPRRGKQFTYALLDDKAPHATPINHDEALAKLTLLYFSTRGPATLSDFVWWSGLSMKDAKAGVAMAGKQLITEEVNGSTYYLQPSILTNNKSHQATFLMPDYDEYGISYKDRSAIYIPDPSHKFDRTGGAVFNHALVIDGEIAGTWRRTIEGKKHLAEALPFGPLSKTKQQVVDKAVKKYVAFANN